MPGGVIMNKGADLPEDQITGLLAAWRNARQNRSTAYLSSNLEFQPTQFTTSELGYNEARQYMALEIARLMNIPGDLIDAQIIRSNTYQNIQDRRRDFVDMSLMNYITAIEDRLSMEDLTPRGQYVKFEINEAFLRSNAIERLTVIEKMLTLGLIDTKQARIMEDLAPSEGTNVEEI
jgi:HK97 family phage portal protein